MRPADVARRWLDAISARDKDTVLAASHEAIEMHGPQGVGVGHQVVSAWFDAMPMRISIRSLAEQGLNVLVRHHIDWLGADGGIESSIDNAALIETRDGKVFSYRRIDDHDAIATRFTLVE